MPPRSLTRSIGRPRQPVAARQSRVGLSVEARAELAQIESDLGQVQRPRKVSECPTGPCAFVSCRHHLAIDVGPRGALKIAFKGKEIDKLAETCALRAAAQGPQTTVEIGRLLAVTPARISQIFGSAMNKIRRDPEALRIVQEWAAART